MNDGPAALRRLLEEPGLIAAPGCFDPFTALAVQEAGFPCVYLGGFATGTHLATTEPLTTMTEQVAVAANIAKAISLPLVVDGHAGWGDAINTARTVFEYERAGIAAMHIEDQEFPKRMSYHTLPLPKEKIISVAEMKEKLYAAVSARQNPDFVIIARTDAVHADGGGLDLAIERANTYAECGVDMIVAFPNDMEEAQRFADEVEIPKMLMYSEGVPRPRPTIEEAEAMGYKLMNYPSTVVMTVYRAVAKILAELRQTGHTHLDLDEMSHTREAVQNLVGIPDLIARESQALAHQAG